MKKTPKTAKVSLNGKVVRMTIVAYAANVNSVHYYKATYQNNTYTVYMIAGDEVWNVSKRFNKEEQPPMAQTPKATRQYVALSFVKRDRATYQPQHMVVYVGNPGDSPAQVCFHAGEMIQTGKTSGWTFQESTLMENLFVVSLSVAKRSYSKVWREYQESLASQPTTL